VKEEHSKEKRMRWMKRKRLKEKECFIMFGNVLAIK
jgi:hypothetical protein